MSSLPILLLIFVASIAILVKASDVFTDAAEKLGIAVGLPPFIVGVTIVSIGTSLPELISSLLGIFQGAPEIVISNVVGSNIANICLVIGIAAIVNSKGLRITYNLVSVDLPLFMGSAFLLVLMAWDQEFSRGESLLLVLGYIMYLFYILQTSEIETEQEKESPSSDAPVLEAEPAHEQGSVATHVLKELLLVVLSSIFIFLGAHYTIQSLIQISDVLNIGREIIAISAVALGTSLPELLVTISAARKGKAEIAIGNVIGSNIFNIFVVVGIPGLIASLPVPESVMRQGMPTFVSASLLMFFIAHDNKITIWEGWLFLILYAWFIGTVFQLL
ncbi:MAG: calcium/sodium antiporter [Leptolyngbyaceae bacterium]|nr:calcium/sodium antiporter [Leptolyngbyaceae bacterium]